MCGIFAYLYYNGSHTRREICDIMTSGLKRLEYRGYDSAGLAIDGSQKDANGALMTEIIKCHGKVSKLCDAVRLSDAKVDWNERVPIHTAIAHTRWATHGVPHERNAHPHGSDATNEFVIVHNGIITNFGNLKAMLTNHGYTFLSETDTEVVAALTRYVYHILHEDHGNVTFLTVVYEVMKRLEGAYAIIFKSRLYPDEIVAIKRGSPLLLGITSTDVDQDFVSVNLVNLDKEHNPAAMTSPRFANKTVSGGNSSLLSPRNKLTEVVRGEFSPKMSTYASDPNLAGARSKDSPSMAPRMRRSLSINAIHKPTDDVEYFLSSDAAAIIEHTRRVLYLEDNDVAHIRSSGFDIYHFDPTEATSGLPQGAPVDRAIKTLEMELHQIMKGDFDHFMAKEIYEQPTTVMDTMRGRVDFEKGTVRLGGVLDYLDAIKRSRRLVFIACGTSYHSAIAVRPVMEEMTGLPTSIELASDFVDRNPAIFRDDTCIFVSQSGETADTHTALEYCAGFGALLCGITNTVGSTIARKTHFGVHVNAGPEIGVASTKAYTSQIIAMLLLALQIGSDSISKQQRVREIVKELEDLPNKIKKCLARDDEIKEMCMHLKDNRSLLLMGRGFNNATCLEGALKIKEVSYMHSEGIFAGELKHGPLALVDKDMPLVIVATTHQDAAAAARIANAVHQVKTRSGKPIIMVSEGDEDSDLCKGTFRTLVVPKTVDCLQCVTNIVPLQLMSYHLAVARGHNVDQPRNLAKSVTVQ